MNWNKIMEPMMTRPDQGWRLAVIEAMQENDRQHLAEYHGEFLVDADDPPTRLSGTMELERCECNEPPYCLKLRDECLSHAGWSFCPNCGKSLAKKEE